MNWLYTIIFTSLLFTSQGSSTPALVPSVQNAPANVENLTLDETEKFDQTYPLSANGKVSVSNINGSITLEAWDRNEVKLEYTKTADTKERLADVEIQIESKPDSFSVETNLDNLKNRSNGRWHNGGKMEVTYHLMVPRGAILSEIEAVNGSVTVSNFANFTKVSAVNGTVIASNLRGTANLSTVNGEVSADFDQLETGSKVVLNTVNGRVKLLIPSDSNATLKMDSLNGSITNEFGLPVRKGKYVGRDLYGRIGSGETQIKLSSVNGGLSVGRKNDGKNPNPATNLLPQKKDDDESWDKDDNDESSVMSAKVNKEIAKATKAAEKQIKMVQPEIATITAESVERAAEAIERTSEIMRSDAVRQKIKDAVTLQKDAVMLQKEVLAKVMDAAFIPSVPHVEKKSESYPVKGIPKVTLDAKGCSVTVRGWEKSEVQYRVTQFSNAGDRSPVTINQDHSDSAVNVTVINPSAGKKPFDNAQNHVHIEIFVPRKSNLKIKADGEIRIDGISGNVDLSGGDESINVRDVDGTLQVSNTDGRIRVIGFHGEIDAQTSGGSISLEGEFQKLHALANIGAITLTLPDDTQVDIETTSSAVRSDGLALSRIGGDDKRAKYRIGKGGSPFRIETDGEVNIRGAGTLRASL